MLCWDGVTVGLARNESVLWADLVHSDGVEVVADLHVAKIEAATGLRVVFKSPTQSSFLP